MCCIPQAVSFSCPLHISRSNARFTLADPMPASHQPIQCPLHVSRSNAPIGLRCSRGQIRTKPSDVAPAPHSRWPNGAQCVHSRRLVRGSCTNIVRLPDLYGEGVLFITTLSCVVHVRLPMRPRQQFWVGNPFTLAEPTASGHNRGVGSANVKRASDHKALCFDVLALNHHMFPFSLFLCSDIP